MNRFNPNTMAQGELFPSASFAYSHVRIGQLAAEALLREVHATPKPGLVDRSNNGSHTDMNLSMFETSARVLQDSFIQCAQAGAMSSQNLSDLAKSLRTIGLQAEAHMFHATGGVNTHKGAIFSMGILCAAAAIGYDAMDMLQENCRKIGAALLETDTAQKTHGLAARETCGTGGIRAEALSGFHTAFSVGLPALEEALEAGRSENDAMVYALLAIMAATEDSNLVHRGGVMGMNFAKKEARRLTAEGPEDLSMEEVRMLDGEFITRNLSPGGSADLLAFSAMLYFLRKEAIHD